MLHTSHRRAFALCLAAAAAAACAEPNRPPLTAPDANLSASGLDVQVSSPGWHEQARTLIGGAGMSPLAASRVLAALGVAQYRAVVDVEGETSRPGNGRSLVEARRGAVAGASVEVLKFFFPAAETSLEQRVEAEANAGPGNVHPHFARGLVAGRGAGAALVKRAKVDRFTAPWTGSVPTGAGKWVANGPPAGATFGGVLPYLLASGDQFRSAPPPEFASAAFLTDLAEVTTLTANRTPAQQASALQWNYPTGSFTPPGYWNQVAGAYIQSHGLDERAATHAFALTQAAMMDALIGCWDAKYYYWVLRPSQANTEIAARLSFLPLPNHPSYPSGHSCVSSAAATVLGHLFPDKAAEVASWLEDASMSRIYAGIHYRFDTDAGKELGAAVARWAIGKDRGDGLLEAVRWEP